MTSRADRLSGSEMRVPIRRNILFKKVKIVKS